jgi:tetratricopeptide (TPR) repeat protein
LGLVRLRQKRFDEGSKYLEEFVKQRPDFGIAQRELGEAYSGMGKYADAIAAYERALRTDSSLRGVYIDIGNSYFFQGNYKSARQYYQKAATQEPGEALPQYNLGVVAEQLRDSEEATKSYKKALEIDPRYESARRALAALYHDKGSNAHDRGNFKQAVEDFTEEIKYGPGARGYFFRAFAASYMVALEPLRDYGRVINDYLEVLKLNSDLRSSAMLNLTEVYILSSRYRDAHDLAESSLKELREQTRDRQIARYLLVVSGILLPAEYTEELSLLRRDLTNQKAQYYGWDFNPFEKFIKGNVSIGEEKRVLILGITDEVRKVMHAKDNVVKRSSE